MRAREAPPGMLARTAMAWRRRVKRQRVVIVIGGFPRSKCPQCIEVPCDCGDNLRSLQAEPLRGAAALRLLSWFRS
jgi:hypothetical protein